MTTSRRVPACALVCLLTATALNAQTTPVPPPPTPVAQSPRGGDPRPETPAKTAQPTPGNKTPAQPVAGNMSPGQTRPANATPRQPSAGQSKPIPPVRNANAPAPRRPIGIRGFGTFGGVFFTATDSFDAVLGSSSGRVFGGGGQVLLPRGFYAEVSASRVREDGERVFVGPRDEVFRLGIPLTVTITPLEFGGGYRYRPCSARARKSVRGCNPRVIPYGGGGFSSFKYRETSDGADPGEDVDDRFNGFYVVGGVEYLLQRWVTVGGEVSWTSVASALGAGGASAAFDEDQLGGTRVRLKISIGR